MDFLSSNWGKLQWSSWLSFSNAASFKNIPSVPGIYRVRAINSKELFYVGETGRNLRERLGDLRRNALKDVMPFNDPHTAAPSLWAWQHAEGLEFECSVVPVTLHDNIKEARRLREGLEFYLLWQYRLEFGSSTRCNHGRFHPHYLKSSDRKKGFRGHRLPDDAPPNKAGGVSLPPLQLLGNFSDNDWMGLSWNTPEILRRTSLKEIAPLPGVYKIFDSDRNELLYVGESNNLYTRLANHTGKSWGGTSPLFSYVQLPDNTPSYQRREIENDLIAGFYALTKQTPNFQLIDHH